MGFVLLAVNAPGAGLLITDATAALPASPWRDLTLALLIAAFGMKIGLAPMHFWMPLTYSAAPIPAAAVLSGAAVKAGVIGLIRFLPVEAALPGWGGVLAAAGFCAAFYGVAVGITQSNPKAVLAYSSISQMGFIAAVLGMGLAAGHTGVKAEVSLYAAHHVLVKGALFLALGMAGMTGPRQFWLVQVPASVLALGLGGMPFTGGAIAKLVVKDTLGSGTAALLAALSAAATTLLMLHFLARLMSMPAPNIVRTAPVKLVLAWLAMAGASIAVPWALSSALGVIPDAFTLARFWQALWPVLLGGLLAAALNRWRDKTPRVPEGDIVALSGFAVRSAAAGGLALEQADSFLRQWPVASLSLLVVVVIFALALLTGSQT